MQVAAACAGVELDNDVCIGYTQEGQAHLALATSVWSPAHGELGQASAGIGCTQAIMVTLA